jgi:hypothetical protein
MERVRLGGALGLNHVRLVLQKLRGDIRECSQCRPRSPNRRRSGVKVGSQLRRVGSH